ncbi:MAG TPA: class I SAM-dependent rRNA methyltransferase [Myxococcaceae bacterium]|nr:class I SAM-dependent rRNA methyltransferase [Myxococcaceae bacterium]
MNLVRLELQRGLGRHLRAGHPWVFRRALDKLPKVPPGSVVDLTEGGKFVARGYFDPHSAIAVRVLTLDPREAIDLDFLRARVRRARALREELLDLADTDSHRLIHGEGDGLPGVVVDLYAGHAVLKLYSAGLTPYRAMLLEALRQEVPGLKSVIGRDELSGESLDPGDDQEKGKGRVLWGEQAPELIPIRERGATFLVDAYRGQKTGFFLDQRENRFLIRRLSRGRTVLNCFSFTGGFSVNAALGGATSVFSVDQDADAVALSRENFSRNGLKPEQHDFLAADAFELMASFKREGRTFDLVILDPPAFAKSQRAVESALDGYASLNRQALALLKPGGLLATASCSARVSPEAFQDAVKSAAAKVGADLALVEERYQPPDHPVRLAFPEGRYLKLFILRVQ